MSIAPKVYPPQRADAFVKTVTAAPTGNPTDLLNQVWGQVFEIHCPGGSVFVAQAKDWQSYDSFHATLGNYRPVTMGVVATETEAVELIRGARSRLDSHYADVTDPEHRHAHKAYLRGYQEALTAVLTRLQPGDDAAVRGTLRFVHDHLVGPHAGEQPLVRPVQQVFGTQPSPDDAESQWVHRHHPGVWKLTARLDGGDVILAPLDADARAYLADGDTALQADGALISRDQPTTDQPTTTTGTESEED